MGSRWEPPRESRQATRESSPWGPAGSRPQQPLGLGAGVCQAAGISGQGRRAGRWPSLPASIVGPCADDLCLTSCRVHMRSLRGVISQKINVRAPHAVVRDAVVVPRGSEARRAPGARPGVFQQGSAFPSVSLALADTVGPRSSRRWPLGVLPGSIAGSFALPRPLPPLRLLCASRYLQYFTCPCLLSHVGL